MTSDQLGDATVIPDGDAWTLIFVRDFRHPPKAVWAALTDPAELDRWAPFAPSRDLGATGEATLTMVDGDQREDLPATVHRVEAPSLRLKRRSTAAPQEEAAVAVGELSAAP